MRKQLDLACSANAKQQMIENGFCYVHGHQFLLSDELRNDFSKVRQRFNELPRDPYGGGANRFRNLRRYSLLPYADVLVPRPPEASTYEQSVALNKDAGGFVRRFEAIPDRLVSSRFLLALIKFDFNNSVFSESAMNTPIDVGVHLIRLLAEPGKPGAGVPDCLHKDGEPFTFIHLVDRVDVVGGESIVADNDKRTLFETTLEQPMDTIGVVDEQVYHQVKRVNVKEGVSRGYRDVILIDFTPMVADPMHIPA